MTLSPFEQDGLTWSFVLKLYVGSPLQTLGIMRELCAFLIRSRPYGWWKKPPFLPIIQSPYLDWRLSTAYGTHTPTFKQKIYDIYQFGAWLVAFRPYVESGIWTPTPAEITALEIKSD